MDSLLEWGFKCFLYSLGLLYFFLTKLTLLWISAAQRTLHSFKYLWLIETYSSFGGNPLNNFNTKCSEFCIRYLWLLSKSCFKKQKNRKGLTILADFYIYIPNRFASLQIVYWKYLILKDPIHQFSFYICYVFWPNIIDQINQHLFESFNPRKVRNIATTQYNALWSWS